MSAPSGRSPSGVARDRRRGRSASMPEASPASRSTAAASRPATFLRPQAATASTATTSSRTALAAGAAAPWSSRSACAGARRHEAPLLRRRRHAGGARRARPRGARAQRGADRRGHRQRRQDQHQGGAAPRALAPRRDARFAGSLNNHWGVPLTLARLPRDAGYGVFEIGMNHPGEIAPLVTPGAAACRDRDHHGRAGPSRVLSLASRRSPTPRPRSSPARAGRRGASSTATTPISSCLPRCARAAASSASSASASTPSADARLVASPARRRRRERRRPRMLGEDVAYRLGAPGRHWVHEQPRRAVAAVGRSAPISRRPRVALADAAGRRGPRRARPLDVGGGDATLIDESYNANPASMRAAIALLGQAPPGGGRRIAVLGDMLELGDDAARRCMPAWPSRWQQAGVDRVFSAGPLMQALWDALPTTERGGLCARPPRSSADVVADGARRRRRRHGQGFDRQPHGADSSRR